MTKLEGKIQLLLEDYTGKQLTGLDVFADHMLPNQYAVRCRAIDDREHNWMGFIVGRFELKETPGSTYDCCRTKVLFRVEDEVTFSSWPPTQRREP